MEEEMQRRQDKAAAVRARQEDMTSGEPPELELLRPNTDWCCLSSNYPSIPTETESFCCNEFPHRHFLLNAVTMPPPKEPMCVSSFTFHSDRGLLETFRILKLKWKR